MGDVVTIDNLIPDGHNANAGTKRGLDLLDQSLRRNGAGRSILIDKHNRVIAGNKTLERAADIGLDDVIVVDSDGSKLVAVRRVDLDLETDPRARQLAYADNRVAEVDLAWDAAQIAADLEAGVDLGEMFYPDELSAIMEQAADAMLAGGEGDEQEPELTRADVPDAVFPTDNEWGVPLLDAGLQATSVVAPVTKWGHIARTSKMTGTYFFYADDYKFTALWDDPSPVVRSACAATVEPNFSTNINMPKAVVLWGIYRKRWLARFWQSFGIRIFVDLNIEPDFAELNMLGVPQGWKAYATRWLDAYGEQDTPRQYEQATAHAGGDVLFLVIGGRDKAAQMCQERGWVHIKEHAGQVNDG